jgi:hypothetical protein
MIDLKLLSETLAKLPGHIDTPECPSAVYRDFSHYTGREQDCIGRSCMVNHQSLNLRRTYFGFTVHRNFTAETYDRSVNSRMGGGACVCRLSAATGRVRTP